MRRSDAPTDLGGANSNAFPMWATRYYFLVFRPSRTEKHARGSPEPTSPDVSTPHVNRENADLHALAELQSRERVATALEAPAPAPRVVGRYVLYGEIASGGMATVHFGRLVGPAGFA